MPDFVRTKLMKDIREQIEITFESNFREAFTLTKLTVLGHVSLLTISKTTLSLQLNTNFLKMLLLTVSYEE